MFHWGYNRNIVVQYFLFRCGLDTCVLYVTAATTVNLLWGS